MVRKNGHELLSNYETSKVKVKIDYKCGHEPHLITAQDYKFGYRCPKCGIIKRCNSRIERGKQEFIELVKTNGYKLLSEYINSDEHVLIDFNCGHKPHSLKPKDYKNGNRCPICGNIKANLGRHLQSKREFIELVHQRGHRLLSQYTRNDDDVIIDFCCGHEPHKTKPVVYKAGNGCPKCGGKCAETNRRNFEELVQADGYVLLSEYVNSNQKVLIDFKCGHEPHWIAPGNYKQGQRCPNCHNSKGEEIIKKYLSEQGIEHESQLKLNKRRYYDIYIPKYHLIVEVHGGQHYEDNSFFAISGAEQQKIDKEKEEDAKALGYNYMIVDYSEHNPVLTLERFKRQFEEYEGKTVKE